MAIQWTEAAIEEIVRSVMREVNAAAPLDEYDATSYCGRRFIGVYEDMKDAIAAAEAGYRAIREMRVEEREKLITSIREFCRQEAPIMAKLGVSETKMGRVDHKTAKHMLVADKTPGTEDIVSAVKTGDFGLTLTEMAPFGVVGTIRGTHPLSRHPTS